MSESVPDKATESVGVSDMGMSDELVVEMNGVVVQDTREHYVGTLNLSGEGNA